MYTSSMNLSPVLVFPVFGLRAVKAITLSSADKTGLYSVYFVLIIELKWCTVKSRGTDINATALWQVCIASSAIAIAFLSALLLDSLNLLKFTALFEYFHL